MFWTSKTSALALLLATVLFNLAAAVKLGNAPQLPSTLSEGTMTKRTGGLALFNCLMCTLPTKLLAFDLAVELFSRVSDLEYQITSFEGVFYPSDPRLLYGVKEGV